MIARLISVVCALVATVSANEPPRPLPGNPGNVFVHGQPVSIQRPGEGAWVCIDFEGNELKRGDSPRAELGKLENGYYEVWSLKPDGSRGIRSTLAVLAPLKVSTPLTSPIALDTAASWFYKETPGAFGFREAASLTSLAGVSWVRDRLRWSDVEPERGNFKTETIYDRSAAAFTEAGLGVLQVFHDTPPWAGKDAKKIPTDLRDVHSFLKTMSARWKGKVNAWEPWNEGDTTNFGGQTGLELANYQKAAFHGIRAGNPDAIVCQNVFAEPRRTGVLENFLENDPSGAFDTFNFHHYLQTDSLHKSYTAMRPAAAEKPVWITEAFYHFVDPAVKSGELELPIAARHERASFVTRTLATALHEGPEKFFTFLLPHYVEGGVLFGLCEPDGTPRAGYVALAAAGRLLADAKPIGKLETPDQNLRAFAFNAKPDGESKRVIVAWSEAENPTAEALLKWGSPEKAYDFLGRPITWQFHKTVRRQPVYLIYPADKSLPLIDQPIAQTPSKTQISPLVIQPILPPNRLRFDSSSWELKPDETLEIPLNIYQFGMKSVEVSLEAITDSPILIELREKRFTIDSLDRREVIAFIKFNPKANGRLPLIPMLVKFIAHTPGEPDAIAAVRFSADMTAIQPAAIQKIPSAGHAENWQKSSSAGTLAIEKNGDAVQVSAELQAGDRWVYPSISLPQPDRPKSDWDGLALTITPQAGNPVFRVMIELDGGARYLSTVLTDGKIGEPTRVIALFRDFAWGTFSPKDREEKLNPARIEKLVIGGNLTESSLRYSVRDVEWIRFAKP